MASVLIWPRRCRRTSAWSTLRFGVDEHPDRGTGAGVPTSGAAPPALPVQRWCRPRSGRRGHRAGSPGARGRDGVAHDRASGVPAMGPGRRPACASSEDWLPACPAAEDGGARVVESAELVPERVVALARPMPGRRGTTRCRRASNAWTFIEHASWNSRLRIRAVLGDGRWPASRWRSTRGWPTWASSAHAMGDVATERPAGSMVLARCHSTTA